MKRALLPCNDSVDKIKSSNVPKYSSIILFVSRRCSPFNEVTMPSCSFQKSTSTLRFLPLLVHFAFLSMKKSTPSISKLNLQLKCSFWLLIMCLASFVRDDLSNIQKLNASKIDDFPIRLPANRPIIPCRLSKFILLFSPYENILSNVNFLGFHMIFSATLRWFKRVLTS